VMPSLYQFLAAVPVPDPSLDWSPVTCAESEPEPCQPKPLLQHRPRTLTPPGDGGRR
jgi:hypothetical protein